MQFDPTLEEKKRGKGEKPHDQRPTAVNRDLSVAQASPRLPLRLDQDVGLASRNTGELRISLAHLTPHRRVVARLIDLALHLLLRKVPVRLRHGLRGDAQRQTKT